MKERRKDLVMPENHEQILLKVKELVKNTRYRLSLHAEIERDADRITTLEIEEALLHNKGQVIEDYPEDQRGHSFLLLGFTREEKPIHVLWSIHEETVVVITVYRPDPELWIDWRIRREKK